VAPDASVGIVVAPGRVLQEALDDLRDRLAAASPESMDSLAALLGSDVCRGGPAAT
jgi:hypothetical protein